MGAQYSIKDEQNADLDLASPPTTHPPHNQHDHRHQPTMAGLRESIGHDPLDTYPYHTPHIPTNGNALTYGVDHGTSQPRHRIRVSTRRPTILKVMGHQLLGAEINGSFQFFPTDALGTVRDVVDDSGAVIQSFESNEHGIPMPGSGASSGTFSPKTYQGGLSVNDDRNDSGLYLMGHRHFDPLLGRFVSRDPIGLEGGLNLYGAAFGNNPVTFVDPSGLQPWDPDAFASMGYPADPVNKAIYLNNLGGSQEAFDNCAISLLKGTIATVVVIGLGTEALPAAGYMAARAGLPRLGGTLTSAGISTGGAVFGTTTYYHGSIAPAQFRATGFQHRPMATNPSGTGVFVSRDISAAQNAIGPNRWNQFTNAKMTPQQTAASEIFAFKVPANFNRLYKCKTYDGWGGSGSYTLTEIEASPYGVHLLNSVLMRGGG